MGPGSAVFRGPIQPTEDPYLRPRANIADRGPVTGPIRNYLINNIIILTHSVENAFPVIISVYLHFF